MALNVTGHHLFVAGEATEAEQLEAAGRAAYMETDYRGAIAAHERAYAAYRACGDRLGAARSARLLAWMNGNMLGDWAVRNGWLSRAKSLLAEVEAPSTERGWLVVLDAEDAADLTERAARFEEAMRLGRRHGDSALEIEAMGWLGLTRAVMGRVQEGLQLLDEAMAAVVAGDVDDLYVIEGTFCGLFWACERFHDVVRAEQWIRAAEDLIERRNLVAVGGFCRAHYGGILTAAGRWEEADVELTEARSLFERGYTALKSAASVRLADLRVQQGRLEEAQDLLVGLEHDPDAARPLARLHLAQGKPALAREVLERRLQDDIEHDVAAPLLALLVEALLALGETDEAADAALRLDDVAAERPDAPYIVASAALARGRVCLARTEGDAAACLRDALASFADAKMPAELAAVRLDLARALAAERPDVAVAEAAAAFDTYDRLQAAREADAAAALLRTLGVRRPGRRTPGTLTDREEEVLSLLAEGLPNAEIAERLYLSRKTVEHHVSRVLTKLGMRNRTEAARAYAARQSAESGRG